MPVHGNAEITRVLTRYRDAIQLVHDEVVKGMNAGKDVFTLMHEIRLPQNLEIGENYGRLTWSIRGIYEGYAGWFDLNPGTMYEQPPSAVYSELETLAGGPDVLARRPSSTSRRASRSRRPSHNREPGRGRQAQEDPRGPAEGAEDTESAVSQRHRTRLAR